MKLKLFTAIAVLAGLAMASGTPEEGKGKKHPGHPGIKQLIEKFDKDGDGKLSAEERKAAGAARKAEFLKKFDKDGDGKISAEEKKAIAAEWKKRRGDHGRRPHPGKRPHTPKGDKPDAKKPHSGKRPHHSKRPHTPKGKKPGKSPAKKK
tara:strand:- start:1613 stop:2062 length:450 start_codon:yes stop_codon:yes gene_type:complete